VSATLDTPREPARQSRGRVLLWLGWRFLPPIDRADRSMLLRVALACAYLAAPVTVAIAAAPQSAVTLLSLICLAVPGLLLLWLGAVPLGERRRLTALALRQVRLDPRRAALISLSRQLAYPAVGAAIGTVLIATLHGPLRRLLPAKAPLTGALKQSSGDWGYAAPLAFLLLIAATAVLSSTGSAELLGWVRKSLTRLDRRGEEVAVPQAQA
jgi:hypothetical protein